MRLRVAGSAGYSITSKSQMMRDQLLLAGVALMRNLKRRGELMPEDEPLDAGTDNKRNP